MIQEAMLARREKTKAWQGLFHLMSLPPKDEMMLMSRLEKLFSRHLLPMQDDLRSLFNMVCWVRVVAVYGSRRCHAYRSDRFVTSWQGSKL